MYIEASLYVEKRSGVEWDTASWLKRGGGEDIVGSRRGTPTMLIQTDLFVDGLEWMEDGDVVQSLFGFVGTNVKFIKRGE